MGDFMANELAEHRTRLRLRRAACHCRNEGEAAGRGRARAHPGFTAGAILRLFRCWVVRGDATFKAI